MAGLRDILLKLFFGELFEGRCPKCGKKYFVADENLVGIECIEGV